MQTQRIIDPLIFIMVILVAIILAIGVLLTILFIQGRAADGSFPVIVEGVTVRLRPNPDDQVILLPGLGQGGELPPDPIVIVEQQPTEPLPPPPPPPTETPIPPPPVSQIIFVNHTVSSGDTLFNVANRYNTTIPLMARYGISSANLIPGNVIAVAVANPAYCPGLRAYVVREGDSAFGLSRSAGISLEQFQQINNFDANHVLRFTDVICLP
jgi:LysM repeat protein